MATPSGPGLDFTAGPGFLAAVDVGTECSGLSGVCLAGIFLAALSFRLCLPVRISRCVEMGWACPSEILLLPLRGKKMRREG